MSLKIIAFNLRCAFQRHLKKTRERDIILLIFIYDHNDLMHKVSVKGVIGICRLTASTAVR